MGHGPGRPVKTRGPGRPVKTRGRPHGHGGRQSSTSIVHRISWAAVRAGPSKRMGRLMGRAETPIKSPHLMGRGPARPIKFREDGPRPGPAHQIFIGWAEARPGSSIFQRMGRGPAQPITFSISHGPARPGPDKRPVASPGIAGSVQVKFQC